MTENISVFFFNFRYISVKKNISNYRASGNHPIRVTDLIVGGGLICLFEFDMRALSS